jgi:hypothetical protein
MNTLSRKRTMTARIIKPIQFQVAMSNSAIRGSFPQYIK